MADKSTVRRLEGIARDIRKDLLDLDHVRPIHIGGDLSVCDVMVAIWQYAMKYDPQNPKWEGRDRFVLSKGHAAAVTSLNQAYLGCYKKEEIFNEYATDNGRFGMHSCNLINPHVEVSTGSLGHGLPVAGGIAAALRIKGLDSRVFVVMGDGEQQEGTIWEAAMSARQFKLGNLVGFVDRNKLSVEGNTEDHMQLEPFADKWRAFAWNVAEINGNDMEQLIDALDALPEPGSGVPTVFICDTIKGKGVSFMENDPAWHLGMLDDVTCMKCKAEIDAAYAEKWGDI